MNRLQRHAIAVLSLLATLSLPLSARATPFDPTRIPPDAKWLFNVDMDALRASKVGAIAMAQVQKNPGAVQAIALLQTWAGINFPLDVHSITLFGQGFDQPSSIVIVDTNMDRNKVNAVLVNLPNYASEKYGNDQVFSWTDKGATHYASFRTDTQCIAGDTKANVEAELDLLEGRSPCLTADSPLAQPALKGALLYAAAANLADFKQANNPLLAQISIMTASFTEDENTLKAHLSAQTPNEDTATQIKAALDGYKAQAILAASAPNATNEQKTAAQAARQLKTATDGKQVYLEGAISLEVIQSALDKAPQ